MSHSSILLSTGPNEQLIKPIKFEDGQAILQLRIKSLPETSLLLPVIINMISKILSQMVESLCILKIVFLFYDQELSQFYLHNTFRDMMAMESFFGFLL